MGGIVFSNRFVLRFAGKHCIFHKIFIRLAGGIVFSTRFPWEVPGSIVEFAQAISQEISRVCWGA